MSRGPAYPYIDLEEAVGLIRKLNAYAGKKPAAYEAVAREAWEVSPTSSSTIKFLAALKYYGLVESIDSDKGNLIKLTDRAARILLDHGDAAVHAKDLRDAALSPRWYKFCWKHWGKEMPPAMRSSLLLEHGFIGNTVDSFLKGYKKTIQYSGLLNNSGELDSGEDTQTGEEDGVPLGGNANEVEPPPVAQTPKGAAGMGGRVQLPPPVGGNIRQDTFTLDEGNVVIQWPAGMSRESLEDFEAWLDLLKRKVKRAANIQPDAQRSDD